MHLLFIYGTRPEAIKLAPVIREARRRAADDLRTTIVSTGQHREMLGPVLSLFGIEPDIDLDLMEPDQSLDELVARALAGLGRVLDRERPDAVIVQGDTSTAMAGAMAAFYRRIPVAHVEAGLRTGNIHSPFPEEINRRIIGQVTRWHLAPTPRAAENLRRENLPPAETPGGCLVVTGNTVIDALAWTVEHVRRHPPRHEVLERTARWKEHAGRRLVLVTGHRRENFGAPFEAFCHGLADIAAAHPEALVVYPVHLNPNVQRPVQAILSGRENVVLAPALDYPVFVAMMAQADLIVTDSGGVQEEAPWLGVPVLVTRTTTERPEAVEAGGVLLVGPDRARLFAEAHRLLAEAGARPRAPRSPYGDGQAARRCVAALLGEPVDEFSPA